MAAGALAACGSAAGRAAAALLALILLAGCGGERAEPVACAPGDAAAPAYRADVDTVQSAVVRALVYVLCPVSADDRTAHRVECVYQRKAIAVAAELAPNDAGLVEVSIRVDAASDTAAKRTLSAVCSRIAYEMSRVGASN